jgi:hypothetical protein
MAGPQWLDRLEAELRRQRLPAGYRARMLEELADHLSELEQENASMEAQALLEERLGDPGKVAANARSEYDRRRFAGRHPLLTFGLSPVFAVVVALYVIAPVAWCLAWLAGMTTPQMETRMHPPAVWQLAVVYGVAWLIRVAPFALMAWLFSRISRRIDRPRWGLLACAIISVLAFQLLVEVHPGPGHLQGRIGIGLAAMAGFGIEQWLQAVLPLTIGVWKWWIAARRERGSPVTACPA